MMMRTICSKNLAPLLPMLVTKRISEPVFLKGVNIYGRTRDLAYLFSSPKPLPHPSNDKPSADQLQLVYDSIQTNLPRLFTHTMDYRIYSQDVVLINNIHNKTRHGLFKYVQQVALLRLVGHLRYAYVKVNLVSMSQHPMEGRITAKWSIVGISGLRVMFKFWKFKLWKWQEIMKQQEVMYDVISHFDVGADGLVYRHIIDRVEEDKEQLDLRKPSKSPLVAKLALLVALFPRNALGEAITCQSILQSSTTYYHKQR